jgi:hypothetical protein
MLAKHPLDHNNAGLSLKLYVPDETDQCLSGRRIRMLASRSKDDMRSPLPASAARMVPRTAAYHHVCTADSE